MSEQSRDSLQVSADVRNSTPTLRSEVFFENICARRRTGFPPRHFRSEFGQQMLRGRTRKCFGSKSDRPPPPLTFSPTSDKKKSDFGPKIFVRPTPDLPRFVPTKRRWQATSSGTNQTDLWQAGPAESKTDINDSMARVWEREQESVRESVRDR